MFEIDFLPVGDGNGDAICVQYSRTTGVYVGVVDGGYADTGAEMVEHIRKHYGRHYFISHMTLSHADNDHATGLVEVMKNMTVKQLFMNRPWLYAAETIQHFHGAYTLDGLVKKMKDMHPYLVQLEEEAAKQGTQIFDAFQGRQIGNFTVLAPSRARYVELIPDLDKTPTRMTDGGTVTSILGQILEKARRYLDESWDVETLSNNPDPVSASNETSVVQYAELDGKRILLTADVGPAGLAEAADYGHQLGLLRPHMIQVPHHGSRRNVTPAVLDRWLGPKVGKGIESGIAICSVSDKKPDFPRGQVSNAFARRGYPVYVTRGKPIVYPGGTSRGWGAATPLPFIERVEDKAA